MRIREVVSDAKLRAKGLLTEAVRFGNKEKMEVIKKSNDFRIGIEYEFEVHENYLRSYDEREVEPSEEEIDREADNLVNQLDTLIGEMSSIIASIVDYLLMETLLNARDFNPNQPVDAPDYRNLFSAIEEMQADDVFVGVIDLINFQRDFGSKLRFDMFSSAIEEYYGTNFAKYSYPQKQGVRPCTCKSLTTSRKTINRWFFLL